MEPQNCTAHVTGDRAEIWAPTQNGEAALAIGGARARHPGRQRRSCTRPCWAAASAGAASSQDFVPQAVLIAKEVGEPVKVVWSREEDTRHDYYRPVAMARMTAGLDADGMPIAWHVRMSGNSISRHV